MVALPIFVIPFTFCYNPALLLEGSALQVVVATITAMIGVVLIDICIVGFLRDRIAMPLRIGMLVGGILMLLPQYLPSMIGFVLGVITFLLALRKHRDAVTE